VNSSPRAPESWKRELRETPDCVPVERFGGELTATERDHVAHCARCEAEMALWEEFRDATPAADEGGAVQWIVAELRRRDAAPIAPRRFAWRWTWSALLRPQALAAATAALVAVVSIGYVLRDPEPSIGVSPSASDIYRSARIEVQGPTGDLSAPPTGFHWVSVPGADIYDVEVLEVDRTVLWRASTRHPPLDPPHPVVARFLPGKAVLWHVTARRDDGTVVAQSGTERFRVLIPTSPQRK